MAVFSDLPNELVIHIWTYVIEPESVESFALVSKRIYGLATPFLKEHKCLKQQFSRFHYSSPRYRAAGLLKAILLNPRIALYIKEFKIARCADNRRELHTSPLQSYSSDTMRLFKEAIRSSFLIAQSEAEDWAAGIERGDEDPILALIIMQPIVLDQLKLCYYGGGRDRRLFETIRHIAQSSEAAIRPGASSVGSEINSNNQADFARPSRFSKIRALKFQGDMGFDPILPLLRTTKDLKSFSFSGGRSSIIDSYQICTELLACSQKSLRQLDLRNDVAMTAECTLNITRFETLTSLSTNLELLLGPIDKPCRRLADVLPISIAYVALFSKVISYEIAEKVVLQMIQSKKEYLPNLVELRFGWGIGRFGAFQ